MLTITFDTHKFIRRLREANSEAEIATKTDLRELEYRLIIKLGTMIVVAIGVVVTLVKLL